MQKALALLGLSDVGKLRGRLQSAFDYYSMSFGLESVGRLTRCRNSAPHYDTTSSPSLPTSLDSATYQSVFLVHALPFSRTDSGALVKVDGKAMSTETRMAMEQSQPMQQHPEIGVSVRYETKIFSHWDRQALTEVASAFTYEIAWIPERQCWRSFLRAVSKLA